MTIGISKDRLMVFKEHCQNQSDLELYEYLLTRCEELSPWQPIESAPKDRRVLLYFPEMGVRSSKKFIGVIGEFSQRPTHWMELPEPPK